MELDDPQRYIFDDPKGISIGGLDFDNPKSYGHVNQNALLEMVPKQMGCLPPKKNGQCLKESFFSGECPSFRVELFYLQSLDFGWA